MAKNPDNEAHQVGGPDGREKTSGDQLDINLSSSEQAYPLNHALGFCPFPRDAARFDPLIKDGNLFRMYAVLYSRAGHVAGWQRGSHGSVYLEEGQCIIGVREAGDVLGVTKNTSQRALKNLEKLGLIERKAGQQGTVVTLLFYGVYGDSLKTVGTPRGTPSGTKMGHPGGHPGGQSLTPKERYNGNNGETGERKNTLVGAAELEAVYQLYPKKTGKAKGLAKAKKKLGTREEFDKFKTAVATMGESWANHDTQFCPGFEAFVNGERWNDDELPKPSKSQSPTGTGYYEHTGTEIYGTGEIKI